MPQQLRLLVIAGLIAGLAGCERDDQIRVYSAPREIPAEPMSQASTEPAEANAEGIEWKLPAGWFPGPAKTMRFATLLTSAQPDAPQVIITRFAAGNFGDLLSNINRWRNMVGLEPLKDPKDQPAEKIMVGGSEAALFDMSGNGKRLQVAMVPVGQTVWFFRLDGPAEGVEQQISNFDAFLKSVQFK